MEQSTLDVSTHSQTWPRKSKWTAWVSLPFPGRYLRLWTNRKLEDQAPNREGKGAITDSQDASDSSTDGALKMRGDIVLMPQPSDDPNDPLNW
jgi:hypothetical protein